MESDNLQLICQNGISELLSTHPIVNESIYAAIYQSIEFATAEEATPPAFQNPHTMLLLMRYNCLLLRANGQMAWACVFLLLSSLHTRELTLSSLFCILEAGSLEAGTAEAPGEESNSSSIKIIDIHRAGADHLDDARGAVFLCRCLLNLLAHELTNSNPLCSVF